MIQKFQILGKNFLHIEIFPNAEEIIIKFAAELNEILSLTIIIKTDFRSANIATTCIKTRSIET